jgi:hypothetical protein
MTPKELKQLEAEAAEQRRRVERSWTELQESVQFRGPARAPRARPQESRQAFNGKLVELCLLAVAVGCLIELFRRVGAPNETDGTDTRRHMLKNNRLSKGADKWKTRPSKKQRKALPAKRVPLLPKRAGAPVLLPDLTAQAHRLN